MYILAFDSSGDHCSASLGNETGQILAHFSSDKSQRQAEALLPLLDQVCLKAHIKWSEVKLIGVTVGPGSFTGLRIALATAQGLALALSCPLIGVSSTEIYVESCPIDTLSYSKIAVCLDSKRQDPFFQFFNRQREPLSPIFSDYPVNFIDNLDEPTLCVGNALSLLHESLQKNHHPHLFLDESRPLDSRVLLKRTWHHFRHATGLPPVPLYCRPPDVSMPKNKTIA